MNRRNNDTPINQKRMITLEEASIYLSVGMNSIRAIAEKASAIKKYGRRILVDRIMLDSAIDNGLFEQ